MTHYPSPEGFISLMTWGVESHVLERFTRAGVSQGQISCERDTYAFNLPGTPAGLVETVQRYYGLTMNAFDTAERNGRTDERQKELEVLLERQNRSSSKDVTTIPATFLRETGRVA